GSMAIAGAYSENLSLAGHLLEPLSAVVVLACYFLGLLFLLRSKSNLCYPAALFAPVLLFAFKHAFGRQDEDHFTFFIFAILAALSYLILFATRKRETEAIVGFFLLSVLVFAFWPLRYPVAIEPYVRLALGTRGLTNLGAVLRWRQTITDIKGADARCLSNYKLPPAVVEFITSRKESVDVIPYELLY